MRYVNNNYLQTQGHLLPSTDNTYNVGQTSGGNLRWNTIFATNGTINTSDGREKQYEPIQFGLNFIKTLKPVQYKWKKTNDVKDFTTLDASGNEITEKRVVEREGKRFHFGLIAQDVRKNLPSGDYGCWGLANPENEQSLQQISYSEFIAPLIKSVQELSDKIVHLENRIKTLGG